MNIANIMNTWLSLAQQVALISFFIFTILYLQSGLILCALTIILAIVSRYYLLKILSIGSIDDYAVLLEVCSNKILFLT